MLILILLCVSIFFHVFVYLHWFLSLSIFLGAFNHLIIPPSCEYICKYLMWLEILWFVRISTCLIMFDSWCIMLYETYSDICKTVVKQNDSLHQMAWFFFPLIHVMTHSIYLSLFVILSCILVNILTQHFIFYQYIYTDSYLVIRPFKRYNRNLFYTL